MGLVRYAYAGPSKPACMSSVKVKADVGKLEYSNRNGQ
jgi:hypothetical protein